MAIEANDDALCRRLLAHGADINLEQPSLGQSPLAMVCAKGYTTLLQTFLKSSKEDKKTLEWPEPRENVVKEQYELFKLKNKRPKKGQTAPDPTPNQREVLRILKKRVAPCVIL